MNDTYLTHSNKGQQWKNHKYIAIKNGRYIYPEDVKKRESERNIQNSRNKSKPNLSGVEGLKRNELNNYWARKRYELQKVSANQDRNGRKIETFIDGKKVNYKPKSDAIKVTKQQPKRASENKIIRKGFNPETEGSGYEGAARYKAERDLKSKKVRDKAFSSYDKISSIRLDEFLKNAKTNDNEYVKSKANEYSKEIRKAKWKDLKKNIKRYISKGTGFLASIFGWNK